MTSILNKVRTIGLSSIHGILDKVIDLNSLGAVRQHVRDLEDAKNDIADQAAIAEGRALGVEQEITELQARMNQINSDIDMLLSDDDANNDDYAVEMQLSLTTMEQTLQKREEELADHEQMHEQLEDASRKVASKYREMLGQLRELERMEAAAKAKEKATRALSNIGRSVDGADSVDSVSRRIRERNMKANARFSRMVETSTSGADDAVQRARALEAIKARREALKTKDEEGEAA